VSFNGGDWPRWKGDTRELYFSGTANPGNNPNTGTTAFVPLLYAVTVGPSAGNAFEFESPREMLLSVVLNPAHSGGAYHVYDVSPDGQRVLLFQVVVPGATAAAAAGQAEPDPGNGLVIAFNWAKSIGNLTD
jgi:hypothetical protein